MGRAKRNPSNPLKQMMGFAALYPSYALGRSFIFEFFEHEQGAALQ